MRLSFHNDSAHMWPHGYWMAQTDDGGIDATGATVDTALANLVAEMEESRTKLLVRTNASNAAVSTSTEGIIEDLGEILEALGLGNHARPISPHQVVQDEILPAIRRLVAARGD